MGCCGNSSPKIVRRKTSKGAVKKAQATPITSIYPKSIQSITKQDNLSGVTFQATTVKQAVARASGVKNCPSCGTLVSTVIAGSGTRKRKICKTCGKQFSA